MITFSGLQWGGNLSLRQGAFLEHADDNALMQVSGIYELQHHSDPTRPLLGIAYHKWLPCPSEDALDACLDLPLYRAQSELQWMTLATLANLVRISCKYA